MRCNRFLSSFVRKNLDEAHKVLVERILKKAELIEQHRSGSSPNYILNKRSDTFSPTNFYNTGPSSLQSSQSSAQPPDTSGTGFQPGSHMSQSKILQSPNLQSPTAYQSHHRPQQSYPPPNLADHPAFRNDQASRYANQHPQPSLHNRSISTNGITSSHQSSQPQPSPGPRHVPQQFLAELPGSEPSPPLTTKHLKAPPDHHDSVSSAYSDGDAAAGGGTDQRYSMVSSMSSDAPPGGINRDSIISDMPMSGSPPPPQQQQQPQILMPYRYNPADFQAR